MQPPVNQDGAENTYRHLRMFKKKRLISSLKKENGALLRLRNKLKEKLAQKKIPEDKGNY